MTLFERLRAFWLGPGLDMGRRDPRYGRMAVDEALATLETAGEWYAWLWGDGIDLSADPIRRAYAYGLASKLADGRAGDAWPDKAPPQAQRQEDSDE